MRPRRTSIATAVAIFMTTHRTAHRPTEYTGTLDRPTDRPADNDQPAAWNVAAQLVAVGSRSGETEVEESQQRSRKGEISRACAGAEDGETNGRDRKAPPTKGDVSSTSRAGDGYQVDTDEGSDDVEDHRRLSAENTSLEERQKDRATQNLRKLIGERIRFARETFGVNQQQFAAAICHVKSTQPSLWEKGHRLPPITELPNIARALGCSVDYLLGVSGEMEHDVGESRRALLVGHLRDQLEAVADHLADVALVSGSEVEASMRGTRLLSLCQDMEKAVQRFKAANAEAFDDMKAGALLVHAARELAEAAAAVGGALDGVVLRRERAALQAKQVMAGGGA